MKIVIRAYNTYLPGCTRSLSPVIVFFLLIVLGLTCMQMTAIAQTDSTITITAEKTGNFTSDSITTFIPLGESSVLIKLYRYGSNDSVFFISLHNNEQTAIEAAKTVLQQTGGQLLVLENNRKRNVQFSIKRKLYTVDPNRIYTDAGVIKTLQQHHCYNTAGAAAAREFATQLLQLIPANIYTPIAIHNNTIGPPLTIYTYYNTPLEVQQVYADTVNDPDDFVLTTDSLIYNRLVEENINTVLQNNAGVTDDGSLSVWYGYRNKAYINCEAGVENMLSQVSMLSKILQIVQQLSSITP